ncbi:MAG: hypothetical protein WB777_19845, partial [Mycobacterium sp.]
PEHADSRPGRRVWHREPVQVGKGCSSFHCALLWAVGPTRRRLPARIVTRPGLMAGFLNGPSRPASSPG